MQLEASGVLTFDFQNSSTSTLRHGLLNGPNDYDLPSAQSDVANDWLSQLNLTTWRFSGFADFGYGGNIHKFVVTDYQFPQRFGTSIVVNLQDMFNLEYGKPVRIASSCSPGRRDCFTSFASLRQAWNEVLTDFLNDPRANDVDYFDILAEADAKTFVNVNFDQIYLLFKDALLLVNNLHPTKKTVGPSSVGFNINLYDGLVSRMVSDGIRLDAISWHELGSDPEVVHAHKASMTSIFTKYPQICVPQCPEIHINEYQSEDTFFAPGFSLGWLQNLEAAGIKQANRSCWGGDPGSPIPYQSCWYGFSGLLMPDSQSPQMMYWLFKHYADLQNSRYSMTQNTLTKVTGIAGNISGSKMGVLVGNYSNLNQVIDLQATNFSNAAAYVEVYKLAVREPLQVANSLPLVQQGTITRIGNTISIPLPPLTQGEAFWVIIDPL